MAPQVYVKYGTNPKMWETTQIVPVLLEELKATTADWTAEQLIQERPNVMMELYEFLENRLEPLGFTVVTVNIEDMQFSKEFTQAIEDKVVATQESLAEKNRVEIVRYQQMQQILQKQGEANRTVIEARALAEKTKIAADAEAYKIFAEYKATADGIQAIRDSLTSDYLTYEMLNQWDGKLPVIIGDDGSLFLDVRALIQEPN
jgi:regulator of protease activity HflC (stomatin/prohibitin superfamily)